MPQNPGRKQQGGDVEGMTPIDVAMGEAIEVANASFDPGYEFGGALPDATPADLKQGFSSYGRSIGEIGSKKSPRYREMDEVDRS